MRACAQDQSEQEVGFGFDQRKIEIAAKKNSYSTKINVQRW